MEYLMLGVILNDITAILEHILKSRTSALEIQSSKLSR
jgi:hypothetical protein